MSSEAVRIAETIRQQIGHRALYMLGAKHLSALPADKEKGTYGGFSFRTGRVAAGKANHVHIELNGMDTYNLTFFKIHGRSFKTIKTIEGVYVDQLHESIEHYTGLYTSL
jgi:hypothetical protein